MSDTFDCAEESCTKGGMTAEQLAAHVVTHGTKATKVTITDDPNERPRLFGRKPKR